jgi:hypothetical protein
MNKQKEKLYLEKIMKLIAEKENELPENCPKHKNPQKHKIKIPRVNKKDRGYTGVE